MAALPYMKLFPNDYFGDTGHLSCLQHGIYLQLILRYFIRGGPLPDDDRYLAALVRLGPREWTRQRESIAAFFQVADGHWHHRRIDRELAAASAKSLQSQQAARAGAKRPSSERNADAERPQTYTESESESPSSIDIELGDARDAREDDSGSGRKKAVRPKPLFKLDGEEPVMEAVRRDLADAIGHSAYALAFCDKARPIAFERQEGRLIALCSSAFAHSMVRDHAYSLSLIAKRHGFEDGWIRERD